MGKEAIVSVGIKRVFDFVFGLVFFFLSLPIVIIAIIAISNYYR